MLFRVRVPRFELRDDGRVFLEAMLVLDEEKDLALDVADFIIEMYRDELSEILARLAERCLLHAEDHDLKQRILAHALRRIAGSDLESLECSGGRCRATVRDWGWSDGATDTEEVIEEAMDDREALNRVIDCVFEELEKRIRRDRK